MRNKEPLENKIFDLLNSSKIEKAAVEFIEFVISTQNINEQEYIDRMTELLLNFSSKYEGFYEQLRNEIQHTDPERMPVSARRFLYSI